MWRCVLLFVYIIFFFFKQKTAYEMRISDWSSDVCSSDLIDARSVHGVDRREHGAHLWPALNREIEFAAGLNEGRRRVALARHDRAQDVDTRMDRAVVIGGPAHERKYGVRAEGKIGRAHV